jgi:hypothetical protein
VLERSLEDLMLRKLAGFGSVTFALSFGVACTSSKDNGAADGGSGGGDVGAGGRSGTGAGGTKAGSGGSTGHDGTGGASTDSGTARHDSGAGGAPTGDSGSTDSGSTGGSGTNDAGSSGGNNVLTNAGFEDGVLSPWTSNSSNFIVGSDAPRSGSYNAKLYSGFGDPTWTETASEEALFLAAGTYTFHIWVEKTGTGALTTLRVEASSSGSTKTLDILQNVTGTYKEFTVTGITVTSPNGPDLGACAVRVAAAGDDHVSVYLDDASLTKDP